MNKNNKIISKNNKINNIGKEYLLNKIKCKIKKITIKIK